MDSTGQLHELDGAAVRTHPVLYSATPLHKIKPTNVGAMDSTVQLHELDGNPAAPPPAWRSGGGAAAAGGAGSARWHASNNPWRYAAGGGV